MCPAMTCPANFGTSTAERIGAENEFRKTACRQHSPKFTPQKSQTCTDNTAKSLKWSARVIACFSLGQEIHARLTPQSPETEHEQYVYPFHLEIKKHRRHLWRCTCVNTILAGFHPSVCTTAIAHPSHLYRTSLSKCLRQWSSTPERK